MRNTKPKKTKSLVADKRLTDSIDDVLPNARTSSQQASLFVFEDNDAVIKMIIEGKKPIHETYLPDPPCKPGLLV